MANMGFLSNIPPTGQLVHKELILQALFLQFLFTRLIYAAMQDLPFSCEMKMKLLWMY